MTEEVLGGGDDERTSVAKEEAAGDDKTPLGLIGVATNLALRNITQSGGKDWDVDCRCSS